MISAPVPDDEPQRVAELVSYDVLDTDTETLFDELTQLASQICETPIALISLVDPDRQWFKSRVGLDATETSRSIAFCSHAILQREVFEINNAKEDPRFHDNPLVTGDPNIRFYAGAPLVTPSGHAIGTLCTISDKPKALTESQKEALTTLSHSVIAHLELRRKNRDLERTSKFRSDFLSYLSHEVRTPLNAINTFSRLLEGEAKSLQLPRSFTEPLGHISKSGERLLEIVNSVLDLKQLEAGKMRVTPRAVSTHDLFTHLFSLTNIRAEDEHVLFEYVIDESVPKSVDLDDTKYSQIALNILSNAVKYTPENKRIFAQVKYKKGTLIFTVKDEGIGISEEEQAKLFKPFERMDNAHSIDGTGLGLNITKQLIALMKGSMKFKSELNQGTRVTISVSAPESALSDTVKLSKEENLPLLNIIDNPNILVVEDHYINQVVIKTVFEKLGVPLTVVPTGEEGVEYASIYPVDLVLMDLNLPGIDGLEATKRIKAGPASKVPVVALTADAISERSELATHGICDILTKPVDNSALIDILNKFLPPTS